MADQAAYCIVEVPYTLILPADVAMKAFPLLCQGEPVTYDWTNSVHKRIGKDKATVTVKQFTIAQYAALALNDAE
jgi:hypothetical protein